VRLLSGSVSTLPIKAYRRLGEDRSPMSSLPQLFDQLVSDGQIVHWLHRCMTSLTLRGNAFGLITERDGYGFPTTVVWLNPSDMLDDNNIVSPSWTWRGRPVPSEDIVHIPWFPLAERVQGLSPIAAFASTFGVGLGARDYARDWFNAGGMPQASFKNTERPIVSQEEAQAIKARLVNAIRSRQPLVHGKDWEFTPISVPLEDSQFLDTMKATTNQVAAIYGIPAEMMGGQTGTSMTYNTVEQNGLNFVTFALRPWLVLLETAFSALLPDKQYVKFNVDALIRTDTLSRHNIYKIDREIGLRSIDEIRALEDLTPLPNGKGQDFTPLPTSSKPQGSTVPTASGHVPSANGQAPVPAASNGNGNGKVPARQLLHEMGE
jgi:HK97 family phage portal protein